MKMPRTVLRDDQWDRIEGFLLGKSSDCGVTAKANRLLLKPCYGLLNGTEN